MKFADYDSLSLDYQIVHKTLKAFTKYRGKEIIGGIRIGKKVTDFSLKSEDDYCEFKELKPNMISLALSLRTPVLRIDTKYLDLFMYIINKFY